MPPHAAAERLDRHFFAAFKAHKLEKFAHFVLKRLASPPEKQAIDFEVAAHVQILVESIVLHDHTELRFDTCLKFPRIERQHAYCSPIAREHRADHF